MVGFLYFCLIVVILVSFSVLFLVIIGVLWICCRWLNVLLRWIKICLFWVLIVLVVVSIFWLFSVVKIVFGERFRVVR